MKEILSDLERLQKAGRIMALLADALTAHMDLIKEQATKNSAKGDEYWAVYSKGIAAVMTATDFIKQDMAQQQAKSTK